jgi:hypothetical protein
VGHGKKSLKGRERVGKGKKMGQRTELGQDKYIERVGQGKRSGWGKRGEGEGKGQAMERFRG